jgi:hypothetical protein
MKSTDKVFLVSAGSYSDYSVLSVWSTRESAEAEVKRLKAEDNAWRNDADVEEFWFNEPTPRLPIWEVMFLGDDTNAKHAIGRVVRERIFIGEHQYQKSGNATLLVTAKTPERAIKVAAERRMSLLAANAAKLGMPGDWLLLPEQEEA